MRLVSLFYLLRLSSICIQITSLVHYLASRLKLFFGGFTIYYLILASHLTSSSIYEYARLFGRDSTLAIGGKFVLTLNYYFLIPFSRGNSYATLQILQILSLLASLHIGKGYLIRPYYGKHVWRSTAHSLHLITFVCFGIVGLLHHFQNVLTIISNHLTTHYSALHRIHRLYFFTRTRLSISSIQASVLSRRYIIV